MDKRWSDYLVISQGGTTPLPNGIPTFLVDISNVCSSGYNISNIHVRCEHFSSVHLINPRVFKHIEINDCLVNNGGISFTYANTFRYDLKVSSVTCLMEGF
ncbi:hypothetical protein MKW92_010751 [Papaver armeniacum]|nr:hypothetical protein MKW92_010751 [Papaver armeniacum]